MFLIQSDFQLKRFFPNVFREAPGEPSFFDKLTPFLQQAEDWLSVNIVSVGLLREAEGSDDYLNFNLASLVYDRCRALVAAWALHAAAPSLDLSLTANGFVTAGTQNTVPVSTQRMERLLRSLASNVDSAIDALLRSLHLLPGWVASPQAAFFAESLFQDLSLCHKVRLPQEPPVSELCRFPLFERFLFLRAKAVDFENVIADSFVSRELMQVLRLSLLSRKGDYRFFRVISAVQAEVLRMIEGASLNHRALRGVVDFIRDNEEAFPEWFSSPTAALFNDCSFKNDLDSSGYFF